MTEVVMTKVSAQTIASLGRVAVLHGGTSAEREVSLISGRAVFEALQTSGVDALLLDVGDDIVEQLQEVGPDRVFIALHGQAGEDGRMQALLEFLHLPYTGSGVQASVLAMDKWRSKQIFSVAGIVTPDYRLLTEDNLAEVFEELGGDLMVKPAHEGSSLGMSMASSLAELQAAFAMACKYDTCVFAERLIRGAEYTVAVLNDRALPTIKLETDRQFYDYEAKYLADDTRYLCPCGLSAAREQKLQDMALQAFRALGCSGWGRVDFMADAMGRFYVLEVNTVPGMTDHSLVPMAARASGMNFEDLCLEILLQTREERG